MSPEPSSAAAVAHARPSTALGRKRWAVILLIGGAVSLIVGVLGGLGRLGWQVPELAHRAAGQHGPLMIAAFFGTVISLERAVALGNRFVYVAPLASATGGLSLIYGNTPLAMTGLALGAVVFIIASLQVLQKLFAMFTVTLKIGADCWLIGTLVWWSTGSLWLATPWWISFLVITIAGERLELTRFLPTPPIAKGLFGVAIGLILLGASIAMAVESIGLKIFSAGLLGLAVWLIRFDIARHNLRQNGITGYMAACLLSGHVWLGVAGLLGLTGGFSVGDAWRDGTLHAVSVGFVFAMVFGHALVIFPALAKIRVSYHPLFYVPLGLLHVSMLVRLGGSLGDNFSARHWGGWLNAAALIVFVMTLTWRAIAAGTGRSPSNTERI